MPVFYEWDVETRLEYPDGLHDIHEHNHAERVADLLDCLHAPKPDPEGEGTLTTELVLVRDEYDEYGEDLIDRSWAYVEDGELPETFENGARVPLKYHRELAAAIAAHTK